MAERVIGTREASRQVTAALRYANVTAPIGYGCNTLLSEQFEDDRRFTAIEAGRSLRILNPFNEPNRELLEIL